MTNKNRYFEITQIVFSLSIGFYILAFLYFTSLFINVLHVDGTFQTASSLFRLLDGQIIGRDFYPYIGSGVVLILYPLFLLFGATLFASQISSTLLCALSFLLVIFTPIFLLSEKKRIIPSLTISIFVFYLFLAAALNSYLVENINLLSLVASSFLQGNMVVGASLRPLRRILPFLMALIFVAVLVKGKNKFKPFLLGVPLGVSFIWSNDVGIPTLIAFLTSGIGIFAFDKKWKSAGLFFLTTIASGILLLFLVTWGNPVPLIKFNFIDVRQDQFWYFLPCDREYKIVGFFEMFKYLVTGAKVYAPISALICLILFLKNKNLYTTVLLTLCASVIGSWLLPVIGGHKGYSEGFEFFGISVLLGLVAKWCEENVRINKITKIFLMAIMICFSIFVIKVTIDRSRFFDEEIAEGKTLFMAESLGGLLHIEQAEYYAAIDDFEEYPLEEYWGIAGVKKREFNELKVDSVIHALGRQRDIYSKWLEDNNPSIVLTTSPEGSSWVSWSINMNWWFYKNLFMHYRPEVVSPMLLKWTRHSDNIEWNKVDSKIVDGVGCFYAEKRGLYELEFYIDNSILGNRNFFIIGSNMSNSIFTGDERTTLNPNLEKHFTPFWAKEIGWNKIEIIDMKNENTGKINNLTVRKIEPSFNEIIDIDEINKNHTIKAIQQWKKTRRIKD